MDKSKELLGAIHSLLRTTQGLIISFERLHKTCPNCEGDEMHPVAAIQDISFMPFGIAPNLTFIWVCPACGNERDSNG